MMHRAKICYTDSASYESHYTVDWDEWWHGWSLVWANWRVMRCKPLLVCLFPCVQQLFFLRFPTPLRLFLFSCHFFICRCLASSTTSEPFGGRCGASLFPCSSHAFSNQFFFGCQLFLVSSRSRTIFMRVLGLVHDLVHVLPCLRLQCHVLPSREAHHFSFIGPWPRWCIPFLSHRSVTSVFGRHTISQNFVVVQASVAFGTRGHNLSEFPRSGSHRTADSGYPDHSHNNYTENAPESLTRELLTRESLTWDSLSTVVIVAV